MCVGEHMAEKEKGKRASEGPHRSILQQFNYSIFEEEEKKEGRSEQERERERGSSSSVID